MSTAVLKTVADAKSTLSTSAVVAWEFSDLYHRGRLPTDGDVDAVLKQFSIGIEDAPAGLWREAAELPRIHLDPVDRMLVAHARLLGATLLSADRHIRRYPVEVIW